MADAQGDIFRVDGLVVEEVYTKTNVAVAKGEVLVFDTDGYAICTAAAAAGTKAYMALSGAAAVAATRNKITIMRQGYGRVYKKTGGGALDQGDTPTFDDDGALTSGGNAVGNMVVAKDAVDDDEFYEVYTG